MTELAAPTASRKTRRLALVAGIVVLFVLAGSAAFAWQKLAGGGAQPHDVLPSSVIAYARLDGDPSASQKLKLLHLLRKSPDLAKAAGIKADQQDLRKTIAKELFADCEINYTADVEPWIGDRFGVGLEEDGKTGLLAIQVSDEKAAAKGLALATGCLGFSDPGVVFTQGYALVGEGQKATAAAAKQAEKSPLADKPAFIEDMDSLGDEGVASVWADTKGLDNAFGGGTAADETLKQARSAAATLRAGGDSIELTGITHMTDDLGKVTSVDLGRLPVDAVLAASISGGGKQIDSQWSSFTDAMGAAIGGEFLDSIEQETGFVLPGDLTTLLGDNITLVAGDRNLATIDKIDGPDGVKDLDVAVSLHSTPAKAFALAHKIATKISDLTGVELAVVETNDGAVIATNEDFANGFTKGKGLRDSASFTSVIADDNSAYGGFYLDIAKAVEVARTMDAPADEVDQLKELKALGLSVTNDGNRVARGTLKLSFL